MWFYSAFLPLLDDQVWCRFFVGGSTFFLSVFRVMIFSINGLSSLVIIRVGVPLRPIILMFFTFLFPLFFGDRNNSGSLNRLRFYYMC